MRMSELPTAERRVGFKTRLTAGYLGYFVFGVSYLHIMENTP